MNPGPTAERSLVFLFLDGVGLGANEPARNPLVAARLPNLEGLAGGKLMGDGPVADGKAVFRALDTSLDVPGLPQSATGQATLLTGVNAARLMSGHYGPWPGPTIRKLLESGSLFSEAAAAGDARLANAYPPGYLATFGSPRNRGNVPVHCALSAGLPLADLDDYVLGEAVPADLTGGHFAELREGLPVRSPFESGRGLAALASSSRFVFFDFWLTDRLGHRGTLGEAVRLLEQLDAFVAGILDSLGRATLLITSDHGNLEDLSVRGHTLAKVPLLAYGPGAEEFADCVRLEDVAPAVRRLLRLPAV